MNFLKQNFDESIALKRTVESWVFPRFLLFPILALAAHPFFIAC